MKHCQVKLHFIQSIGHEVFINLCSGGSSLSNKPLFQPNMMYSEAHLPSNLGQRPHYLAYHQQNWQAMTNLDRDVILPTKDHLVRAIVFLVVVYGCESWTIKKAEHWRIDHFELWCRRRLLQVPWAAWRSNKSILKEINPEYSLEELVLKLQYFGHLMWRTNSLGKTLMLGKM